MRDHLNTRRVQLSQPIRAAVMGAGRWGRNLVRVLESLDNVRLEWIVDPDPDAREAAREIAPGAKTAPDISQIDSDIQMVSVCTPAAKHVDHVHWLLGQQKNVLVEKPFAMSSKDAANLALEAGIRGVVLMVGHQMLFHPAFQTLRKIVQSGSLGRLRAIESQRTGAFDPETEPGALWSYGPHDAAMVLSLTDESPCAVDARGARTGQRATSIEVADIHMTFPSGTRASIHLSAANPTRNRRIAVVGDRATAVFDDAVPGGRLHIRPAKGIPLELPRTVHGMNTKDPEVTEIDTGKEEPLKQECVHFVDCVLSGTSPLTGTGHAIAVTKVLEAAAYRICRTLDHRSPTGIAEQL